MHYTKTRYSKGVSAEVWLNLTRVVIVLLTISLVWMTYRTYQLLEQFRPPFNVLLSPPETIARLGMVGLCLFLAWLSGLPTTQLGLVFDNLWFNLIGGIGLGIVILIPLNLISNWAIKQVGPHIYSPWLVANIMPKRRREWLLVPLAFIPAVMMEELLFRSLLLGCFWMVMPTWMLILSTSIIFGLMHLPQGRLGTIGAGSLNIILAIIFVTSWNIIIPFMAHYTINVLQVFIARFQGWDEAYKLGEPS